MNTNQRIGLAERVAMELEGLEAVDADAVDCVGLGSSAYTKMMGLTWVYVVDSHRSKRI